MRLTPVFTGAALCMALAPSALAGLVEDVPLCRKNWWGVAQAAACGRVIGSADADDLARAEAYAERARTLSAGDGGQQALDDLAESIRLAPWNPEAFRLRALLNQRRGDVAQALADYSSSLAIFAGSHTYAARARLHSQRGDSDKAIADLTEAIALEPADTSLLHERAAIYLARGDAAAAIADFDSALQGAGTNPLNKQRALAGRAKGFLALGDTVRAIADATAALALNPKSGSAALTRAEAYVKTGENIPAIADAAVAITSRVGGALPHLLRAEARLRTGDVAGARNDIAMAEILAPEDIAVKNLSKDVAAEVKALGLPQAYGDAEAAYTICLNSRDNDETMPSCAQVIADQSFADARKGYPHNILGHFYYERGLYGRAAESFSAAIATGQTSAPNFSMLGLTFSNQKKYREAIAAYQEGVKHAPAQASLISGLANAQERSGDCKAALVNFAEAIRLAPNRNDYQDVARCLAREGSYAAAAGAYGEALKLETNPRGKKFLLKFRAEAHAADGNIDRALQDMWSALALQPDDPSSQVEIAELLLMAGKPKDAAAVLSKAIAADPQAMHLVALRARAYLQAGNLDAAWADANTAANGKAKYAGWLLVRAEVRLAMKDFAAARSDVASALAADPFSFEARASNAAIDKAEAAK